MTDGRQDSSHRHGAVMRLSGLIRKEFHQIGVLVNRNIVFAGDLHDSLRDHSLSLAHDARSGIFRGIVPHRNRFFSWGLFHLHKTNPPHLLRVTN